MQPPAWSPAERAAIEQAVGRGHLTRAQVAQAVEEHARLATSGRPRPLLEVVATRLPPEHAAALQQAWRRAQAQPAPRATEPNARTTVADPDTKHGASPRPSQPGSPQGEQIGGYVVERELARGGMGRVLVARDPAADRRVAIKVALEAASEAHLARFTREAEAAAKLTHPGIVKVHAAGRDAQGRPYLVMDLVEGGSLQARIERDGPLEPREAAALLAKAARAIEHAHARGVLHRDLKPDNVIVRPDGEPVITDFGLALDRSRERLTHTHQVMGTPAFMPPEQTEGLERVDERADVYSLGATLYAALTGRPPFEGESSLNVLAAVIRTPPTPPSRIVPRLDPDLETIVLACLGKAPEDRPASAALLGDELERWLRGEPIETRRPAALERARRAIARRPALAALPAAALVGLLGLGALAAALGRRPPATPPAPPAIDWGARAAELDAAGDARGAIAALGSALADRGADRAALLVRRAELQARALGEAGAAAALEDYDAAVAAIGSTTASPHARAARLGRAELRAARGELELALADLQALAATGDATAAERVPATRARLVEAALDLPLLDRAGARSLLEHAERLLEEDRRAPAPGRALLARGARGVARWTLRRHDDDRAAALAARADLDPVLERAADRSARFRLERARTWGADAHTVNMGLDLDRAAGPVSPSVGVIRAEVACLVGALERQAAAAFDARLDERAPPPGQVARDEGRRRFEAALADLDRALRERDAPWPRLLRARARRLLGAADPGAAQREVEEDELAAVRGADELAALRPVELARLLCSRGLTARALEVLGAAIAREPDELEALSLRATLRMSAEDPGGALADLERLLALAPDDLDALDMRWRARAATGDARGAAVDLAAWREAAPGLQDRVAGARADRQAELLASLRDAAPAGVALASLRAARADTWRAFELLEARAEGAHSGERVTAEAALDRALERAPDLLPALRLRAEARRLRGATEPALADLARCAALEPTDASLRAQRAELLLAARRFAEARDEARAAGDDPRARLVLARALFGLDEPAAARAAVDALLARDPSSVSGLVLRARLRLADDLPGATADADAAVAAAAKAEPSTRLMALQVQSDVAAEGRDFARAVAILDEAVALAPQVHALVSARATLRAAQGDSSGAVADFVHAGRLATRAPEAQRVYRAEAQLHRRIEAALPGDAGRPARAALVVGIWRAGRRDPRGALAAYDEAARLAPDLAIVRQRRAVARLEVDDLPGAREDLDAWVRLEPRNGLALLSRGVVRGRQGDRAGALEDLERSLVVQPNHARADLARQAIARLKAGQELEPGRVPAEGVEPPEEPDEPR